MEYIVYAKTNSIGYITAVNSSAFLIDTTGWSEIDRGYGDKYHHAQGNYFHLPIVTDGGAFRYKMVGGSVVERSADEIAEDETVENTQNYTLETRVSALEENSADMAEALNMILSGVTE